MSRWMCSALLLAACDAGLESGRTDLDAGGERSRDGGRNSGSLPDATGPDADWDIRPSDSGNPECGNGICVEGEDATSCCEDCGVCDDGATVRIQTGVLGGEPGGDFVPGGMADAHADYSGGPFAEVVYPFTIEEEPVAGSDWFWAQQFFFEGTDQGGYVGVQGNGWLGGEPVGKMMIGSIWDATEATSGPQGSCEQFGGEGVGYSCRRAFQWRENVTYRMIVRESAVDRWSIVMHDPTIDEEVLLGEIRVPSEWGRIRAPTAGFAEYYGAVANCQTIPHAVALLHAPSADGAAPASVSAGTYGPCAAQATSTCSGELCVPGG